jgi:hypothetical protein
MTEVKNLTDLINKRTAEISKEEYFGMLSSANSIQGDGNAGNE